MFPVCHDSHSMNRLLPSPSPHWGLIFPNSKWAFQGCALKPDLHLSNFILLKPKYQYQMYLFLGKIHALAMSSKDTKICMKLFCNCFLQLAINLLGFLR